MFLHAYRLFYSWYGFRYNDIDIYENYNAKEEIEARHKLIVDRKYKIKADPINNEKNLEEAMKSMMDQENLKDKYSKNAIARANDFDIKTIIKQYESVICAE